MEQEGLVGKLVAILEDNATVAFSLAREVGSEIATHAAEGVAKWPARIGKAATKAVWNKIKSSVADRKFEQQWAAAKTRREQESAVRQLIESSPKLARDLIELLQQRAYLDAVREHCQQLPFLSTAFPSSSIRDVFIDLPVRCESDISGTSDNHTNLQASDLIESVLSREHTDLDRANYACFGGPGSGKSMLCRSLIAEYCERILLDADKVDDATLVLPAYVRATDLVEIDRPFVESLKLGIERELGPFLKFSLDTGIFEYRSEGRTRRWFVVVDGIDEISDREKRLKLVRAIRAAHIDGSNTFRFFISSRDNSIAHELLEKHFHIVALDNIGTDVARSIFTKYSAALGRNVLHDSFLQPPLNELRPILSTPLLIAIASSVLTEPTNHNPTLFDLFDDFVKTLLAKRRFCSKESEDIRELLCDIAESGERIEIDKKLLAKSKRLGLLEPPLPTPLATQKVLDRLLASGLVLVSGDAIRFIHASFRQFFRATRFAAQNRPAASVWHLLDPYANGWDFVQFVFERWNAEGHNLDEVCSGLLSYGRNGLKVLSRLAGQNSRLAHTIISAAIAKWRVMLEQDGSGYIDGAVDNLSLMARHYDAAISELRRIAFDNWNYFEDAIEAARSLARHNQVKLAHDALMRIATAEYPPEQAEAAEALCEIGFREAGINLLTQFLADWAQPNDEEFLGYLRAIEALHRHGEPDAAYVALDAVANQENLQGMEVHFIAETYAEVIHKEAAIEFLKTWLSKHPQISHGEEILVRAQRDIRDHKLADLLKVEPSRDYEAETAAEFQQLVTRVSALRDDHARMLEIARNAYLGTDMRSRALKSLAQIDDVAYREAAMEFMADCNVAFHAKKELISELRSRGCEIRVAEVLTQCVSRSTDYKASDAELLIRVGARTKGIELLQTIASNPNARPTEEAEAICALANFGASKFALTRFRALLAKETCVPSSLEPMAQALLVTEHAAEVDELLWRVLRNKKQTTAIRLKASRLLSTPQLKEDKRSVIIRFLKSIATRKAANPEDRFEAIDHWSDFDLEAASDLCYEIAADPDTPFEEGMEAAQRLKNWADEFTAVDAYENVVWDSKISLAQSIEGLLHIHELFLPDADDGEFQELRLSAREELLRTAQDSSVNADIRLKALGLPSRDSIQSEWKSDRYGDWPLESAVETFLHENAVSPRLKQECILRFCRCRPTAISKYLQYLTLDTDDVGLMFDCLQLLEESRRHEVALQRLVDLAENVKITTANRLKALRVIHRIGEEKLALRLAEQISRDHEGNIRLPAVSLVDLASFLLDLGSEAEALSLCQEALDVPLNADDEDRLEIVEFLARKGFSLQAKAALRRLMEVRFVGSKCPLGWLHFHAANMLGNLGETEDALEALMPIARHTSMNMYIRIEACRRLSSGNRAEDAREILREVSRRKSLSQYDRTQIAECYADLGLTQWAQEQVLDLLKNAELSSYARTRIRKVSMQLGLESQVEVLLARNETDQAVDDDAKVDQIKTLVSMERWETQRLTLSH